MSSMSSDAPETPPRKSTESSGSNQGSQGERCVCGFCSKELKDDRSIWRGYCPVCPNELDPPRGGSGDNEAGKRRLIAFLRKTHWVMACWAWIRTHRRIAVAVVTLCCLFAATELAVTIGGWLGRDGDSSRRSLHPRDARILLLPVQDRARAKEETEPVQFPEAREPVVIHVYAGSPEKLCNALPGRRRMLAERAAQEIVPAVDAHPRGVVVLELRDTPFSFESLSPSDQTRIKRDHGARAATIYEWAVGALLHTIINTVASERPEAVLSVLGLPVEPEEMGLDAEMARRTNERYRNVIDRLGPFVPTRSFVVFGTSLDATNLATMGMREAVRLRDGRPIVFQMNFKWRVLADTDDAGYLLADSSAESAQMSEVRGQDQPELYLEASLLDD